MLFQSPAYILVDLISTLHMNLHHHSTPGQMMTTWVLFGRYGVGKKWGKWLEKWSDKVKKRLFWQEKSKYVCKGPQVVGCKRDGQTDKQQSLFISGSDETEGLENKWAESCHLRCQSVRPCVDRWGKQDRRMCRQLSQPVVWACS